MTATVSRDEPSNLTPQTQTLTIAKGLNLGLRAAMEADDKVVLLGEDIGRLGGVFRITDGLQKDFGEQRVLDTPLSESGIIGAAIGLAVRGYRPVCEIQFDGFIFPGFDQIISQLAKLHYRSQGRISVPVVVRVPYGGGIGAVEHHSESPESLFCHIAGVKVVSCANPADAHWMIQQAIATDDPVLFFEPKRRYWEKGEVDMGNPPASLYASRVVRTADHSSEHTATIATYGPQVRTCLDAAVAATEDDISIEVVDLRSLSPLDLEPVFESVRRTGRLVVVNEAPPESSVTSEIATRVQHECFYSLEAPVHRVTGFDAPYPPSKLEEHYLPDLDRVLHAVDQALAW